MLQTYNHLKNQIIWVVNKWRFSLFLSLPCSCQCRFKRYIAKQTQKLKEPFLCDVSLLSRPLVCFLFLSLSIWQATNHMILSYFLFYLHFSFFKDYNKNVRDLTFRSSFFLSFFLSLIFSYFFTLIFSFFKDYNKNVRDHTFRSFFLPSFLSFFLFQLSSHSSVVTADSTACLLSFPFSFNVASYKSYESFVLSFFLSFFFSFFRYYVYRHKDLHTECYTCVSRYLIIFLKY